MEPLQRFNVWDIFIATGKESTYVATTTDRDIPLDCYIMLYTCSDCNVSEELYKRHAAKTSPYKNQTGQKSVFVSEGKRQWVY